MAASRVLADGNEIPLLGLGVWQVPEGPECEQAVRWALDAGAAVFDFALSEQDMAALDALDETGGTDRARESRW